MPTTLVLHFDQPLDPARAEDVHDYRLMDAQGRKIAITSADYNSTTDTVTLHPSRRLNFHRRFKLTVDGTSAGGVTSMQGILLDGKASGQPGSNYVTTIERRDLVPPDPARKLLHRAPSSARFRSPRPHTRRVIAVANEHPVSGDAGALPACDRVSRRPLDPILNTLRSNELRKANLERTTSSPGKLEKSVKASWGRSLQLG
jgi:hypothetical protein